MLRVEPTCFRRILQCRRGSGELVRPSSIKKLLQAPKTVTIFRSSDTSLPFFRAASQTSGTWGQPRVGIVFLSRRTSHQHVWFLGHLSDAHLLQHTRVRGASPDGATSFCHAPIGDILIVCLCALGSRTCGRSGVSAAMFLFSFLLSGPVTRGYSSSTRQGRFSRTCQICR